MRHSPNVAVRPIDSSHIVELIRIGEETNLSPWSAISYLEELKNPRAIMLRAESEENLTVGFVVGRLVAGGAVDVETEAEIYNIAVSESFRRRGNGQLLLDAFAAASHEKGAQRIWLEVRESNSPAIRFYLRNGFRPVQTRPNFYNHPREAAILMRAEIPFEKG